MEFVFSAKTGVKAKAMRSQFPTKSYPNQYSIVTVSFNLHILRQILSTRTQVSLNP